MAGPHACDEFRRQRPRDGAACHGAACDCGRRFWRRRDAASARSISSSRVAARVVALATPKLAVTTPRGLPSWRNAERGDGGADSSGDDFGDLRRRCRRAGAGFSPPRRIATSEVSAQLGCRAGGDALEAGVAARMAVGVVEALKVIGVEDNGGDLHRRVDPRARARFVEESGGCARPVSASALASLSLISARSWSRTERR